MRSVLLASLASLSAVGVHGHPHASQSRNGLSRRAIDLDAFRIKHAAEYMNVTVVQADPTINTTITKRATAQETADDLVKATMPGATFRLAGDSYVGDNGIAHFYYKQTANGLDIDTADFNVNVSRQNSDTSLIRPDYGSLVILLTILRLVPMALSSHMETLSTRARSRRRQA
jgi:extracellular elastinolytic metalloproteinase